MTNRDLLAIYDRLTSDELAMLMVIGGDLPPRSKNRHERTIEAKAIIQKMIAEREIEPPKRLAKKISEEPIIPWFKKFSPVGNRPVSEDRRKRKTEWQRIYRSAKRAAQAA